MALTEAEELELLELEEQEASVPQSPDSSFQDAAMSAGARLLNAPLQAARNLTPEKMSPYLPAAGAIAGGTLLPGAGAPIGAGLGQIGARVADLAYGRAEPAGAMNPAREALGPMVQAGLAGLPEVGGIKKAVQNVAQNQGVRALGYTKRMLKRFGGEDAAKETAQTMLDKGVIKFGAGAKSTLERAEDLASDAGSMMTKAGESFTEAGLRPLDTNKVISEVRAQLTPKFKGGAYDAEHRVLDEITDTIKAHGEGPIDFQSAQTLKEKLQELGKFLVNTDSVKSNLYRRASGIVRQSIDDAVGSVKSPEAAKYLEGKKLYGQSQRAVEGLTDRVAADAANNAVSLRGVIAGAGALGTGNLPAALGAVGAFEGIRRVGSGSAASLLNFANQSAGLANLRRAILSKFVDRFITNHGD